MVLINGHMSDSHWLGLAIARYVLHCIYWIGVILKSSRNSGHYGPFMYTLSMPFNHLRKLHLQGFMNHVCMIYQHYGLSMYTLSMIYEVV